MHDNAYEFSCKELDCGRMFPDFDQLARHVKKRHNKDLLPVQTSKPKAAFTSSMAEELEEIERLTESVDKLTTAMRNKPENDEAIYARSSY